MKRNSLRTHLRSIGGLAPNGLITARIGLMRVAVMFLLLLMLAAGLPAQVTTHPVDWVGGDVFAASGGGGYQVWHSANPTATNASYGSQPEQTISDGSGGVTGGCGFDLAYRFFGTNVAHTFVDRYSIANAHPLVQQLANSSTGSASQSVALDAKTNLFVGYAGGVSGGFGTIEQWTKDTTSAPGLNSTLGTYVFSKPFSVPVDGTFGPGWIDLAFNGHSIFYTAQTRKIYKFDSSQPVTGSNPVVWADLSTLTGQNKFGTLYAIKILGPSYDGTDGVLVADKGNVKLIRTSGGAAGGTIITPVPVFTFGSLANLQALTLDSFSPLTTFWVGDASATTNNLLRFNKSTGTTEATISTGTGVGGVCLDAGFNGAELAFQPSTTIPNFQTSAPFILTPPTQSNPTSNTFSFTSPFTGEILTATLPNLKNNVTVTIRDSLVDSSVALSDPTVFAVNPGAPVNPSPMVPGNMSCDTTLTGKAGFPNTCEVLAFEANPNYVFDLPNIIIDKPVGTIEVTPNLRLLSNLDEDGTDGVINYPTISKNCVLTVNQQTSNGNFQICSFSPADGTVFSKSAKTSTITFTLDVAAAGQCGNNQTTPNFLKPLLLIAQLQTPDPATGVTPAPVSIPVLIAGKSGGPPVMPLSGNTYQLQVKTTDMPPGFTYLATVIDLSGTIPSISSHFSFQ